VRKVGDAYKKPTADAFRKAVGNGWGALSSVGRAFSVYPSTVSDWIANDEQFKAVMDDATRKTCDQIIGSMVLVATGIPNMQENPSTGRKEFVGWIERPDVNAGKYLLETMGRRIGWGVDDDPLSIPRQDDAGVDITAWVRLEAKHNSISYRAKKRKEKAEQRKEAKKNDT
jgi:hypothetical protein